MFRSAWTRVLFGLLMGGGASAQVIDLPDDSSFSEDAIHIEFARGGAFSEVSNYAAALGVHFSGEGSSRPRIESVTILPIAPPSVVRVVRNVPPDGLTSAGLGMVLRFERPLRRVGVFLGNGDESTVAELSAFTAGGRLLGTIERSGVEPLVGPFAGIETTDPEGISTLTIDYREAPNAEQIEDLRFEYLSPRTLTTCAPQVADGVAGDRRLSTILQIVNISNPQPVRLDLFDTSGQPLTLSLAGEQGSSFTFEMGLNGMVSLSTDGASVPTAVGYACVESREPVSLQAVFRTEQGGQVIAEAGASGGAALTTDQFVAVELDSERGLDTGIALVSLSGVDCPVTLRLSVGLVETPGEFAGHTEEVELPARSHRAFFVRELFPELPERFQGTLAIIGECGVRAVALRTIDAFPVASLPSGSWEEPG